jgi:tRNA dimethylallyltransferase
VPNSFDTNLLKVRPLLVIVGPTGAGKTELAIRLAERCGGEVISADSQQVYRGMDIGTGKASAADRERVPHHLLDVLNPDEEMSAARFVQLADAAIADLQADSRPAIVAGGTMLYVRALLQGLFEGPAADVELRAALATRAEEEGVASLWKELEGVDPVSAERIHVTDLRRIVRALEVYRLTGIALSQHHDEHRAQPARYQSKIVGVQPERDLLYAQIDARVEGMIAAGLVEEVEALRRAGYGPELRSQQAIGYGELHRMLDGELDMAKAVEEIQKNSRRYARRQLSWYRGDERVQWWPEASAVDLEDLERYLVAPGGLPGGPGDPGPEKTT